MATSNFRRSGHSQRKTCIRGTRITVYDILEYLAGGMTEDAILSNFPDLTRDAMAEAVEQGLTVSEYAPNSPARLEFKQLAKASEAIATG